MAFFQPNLPPRQIGKCGFTQVEVGFHHVFGPPGRGANEPWGASGEICDVSWLVLTGTMEFGL